MLTQKDERGKEVLIAAASQRLGAAEMKWSPYDRELYAIVYAIRTFSHYLKFRPFTVFTDHRPLLSCLTIDPKKDATGRRTRWALELSGYDFKVKYKQGKSHGDADALSRATHGDSPSKDHRDDDDLVILGATQQGDGAVYDLLAEGSNHKLREEQEKDPAISLVMKHLVVSDIENAFGQKSKIPKWYRRKRNSLAIIDGILYQKVKESNEFIARAVIPQSMVTEVLNKSHGDYRSGHPGERRLRERLERFCIWPGMRKDVIDKVATCFECQAYRPLSTKEVPIIPQKASYPMHYVVTDLLALKPPSEGFDHVLVLEDRFTRFCTLYPMRGAEATTMARNLEKFITIFGFPTIWASDNGPEFKNRLVEALCHVYDTKKEFSLAYHPQKQGSVERKNRTLIQELAKKCLQFGTKWSKHLKWIEFALNSTPHRALGRSPYAIMFGRDPRVPTQNILPAQPIDTKGWKTNMKKFWKDTQIKVAEMHKMREEHINKYHLSFNPPNAKRRDPFTPGDWVLMRLPRENRAKLSLHFCGPFVVKKKIIPPGHSEGNVYVVVDGDGKEYCRSQVDLKPYKFPKDGPEIPIPIDSLAENGDDGNDDDDREKEQTKMILRSHTAKESREREWKDETEFYDDDDSDEHDHGEAIGSLQMSVPIENANGDDDDDGHDDDDHDRRDRNDDDRDNDDRDDDHDDDGRDRRDHDDDNRDEGDSHDGGHDDDGSVDRDIVDPVIDDNVGAYVDVGGNVDDSDNDSVGVNAGGNEDTVYHDALRRNGDSESSNGTDIFATPNEGNTTRFDSILSEDDSSSNLRDLPNVNLLDRFEQQMESDGSTEPGISSPMLNLSPIVQSRSPARSRSPLHDRIQANPTAPLEPVEEEGAAGGDPQVKEEAAGDDNDDEDVLDEWTDEDPDDEPDDVKNMSTKARKGSSYDDMDDPDDDIYEPDDVKNMSTKARKGSSANPSPPHSSTPTPAMARELRRLGNFNNPGLKEGLGRGRTRSRRD